MTLSILYGSTLWFATTFASAQVAFQATFPAALRQHSPVAQQAADEIVARAVAAASISGESCAAAHNCPYCDYGPCVVCNQGTLRFDLEDRALAGWGYDEPCFTRSMAAAPLNNVALPAPRATEPDDVVAVAANEDAERGGMLQSLASFAERAPGSQFVRNTLSAGVKEASRAAAMVRGWLSGSSRAATVAEKPAVSKEQVVAKLRSWFGEESKGDLAANGEVEPADGAEMPSEAVAMVEETESQPAVTAHVEVLDWEGELARDYVASQEAAAEARLLEQARSEDPRQDVVTPTIRTAAVALEQLGNVAFEFAARLRGLADATKYQ